MTYRQRRKAQERRSAMMRFAWLQLQAVMLALAVYGALCLVLVL